VSKTVRVQLADQKVKAIANAYLGAELHDVLGGSGTASLRNDSQGKAYAQILLDYPIPIPAGLDQNGFNR
jgi:hypothetical protein